MTPDASIALGWLRMMKLIRRFEEQCVQEYSQGHIRGFLHLYIGQEACAVGVISHLGPDDSVVSHYREHGHALVRGISAGAVMAEMFGKQEGCSKGHGGSMHLFDASKNFFGGNAIVGGGLPLAAGLALADKLRKRPYVTCCFLGDGAVAEGVFHETMNLSALWKLPVLFVCENNLYAMGTALSRYQAAPQLLDKARSDGVRAASADGMNVEEVSAATLGALEDMRQAPGPYFLELRTYRFRAHSMYDSDRYRPKSEVASWKERDPILLYEQSLRARGLLDDAQALALQASVEQEVQEAVAFAHAGTLEPLEKLLDDVLAPRGSA